jgi:CHAP domain
VSIAEKVVDIAEGELDVTEVPMGSNRGPRVQQYQAATVLAGTGWAWCAAFVEWCWERAGLEDHPANPSTFWFCKRAEGRGEFGPPRVGGAIIWCGTHVGLVVAVGDGIVHTIEGNSGDRVSRRVRAIGGARFINPRGLGAADPSQVRYWLEDVGADVKVYGPWKVKPWPGDGEAWAREHFGPDARVVHPGVGGVAVAVGRRYWGPWRTKARQVASRPALEARLGRRLRPFRTSGSSPLAGRGEAEAMGKVD